MPARTYIQSTIDTVKRGGDQPPWWNVAMIVGGVIFAVVFAWSFMTDTSTPAPAPAPATQQPVDDPTEDPTQDPTTAPTTPVTPTKPAAGGTTSVKTTAGETTTVPTAGYLVAKSALVGQLDPAEAAHVEMADGESFPVPSTPHPDAKYSALTLSAGDDKSLTFVASADPDGQGPQRSNYYNLRVIKQGTGWKFTTEL